MKNVRLIILWLLLFGSISFVCADTILTDKDNELSTPLSVIHGLSGRWIEKEIKTGEAPFTSVPLEKASELNIWYTDNVDMVLVRIPTMFAYRTTDLTLDVIHVDIHPASAMYSIHIESPDGYVVYAHYYPEKEELTLINVLQETTAIFQRIQ